MLLLTQNALYALLKFIDLFFRRPNTKAAILEANKAELAIWCNS